MLNEPPPHVLGYLECMWMVGYQHGNPVLGDEMDVELAAQYPGERGVLCKALLDCRFIDKLPDGQYQIHDLFDHAPEYVHKRMLREQGRKRRYAPRNRKTTADWRGSQPISDLGCLYDDMAEGREGSPQTPEATRLNRQPKSDIGKQNQPKSDIGSPPAPTPLIGEVSPITPLPPNKSAGESQGGTPATPDSPVPATATPHPEQPESARTGDKAAPKQRKPRQRDPLWDAIVAVTGFDPSASKRHIGAVHKSLREADQPYTAEEVLALPAILKAKGLTFTITPGSVEKYIGWTRSAPASLPSPSAEPTASPETLEAASRVVGHYQSVVQPGHDEKDGIRVVLLLLCSGQSAELLMRTADGYAAECRARGTAAQYRKSVRKFYGDDATYKRFLTWTPPKPTAAKVRELYVAGDDVSDAEVEAAKAIPLTRRNAQQLDSAEQQQKPQGSTAHDDEQTGI